MTIRSPACLLIPFCLLAASASAEPQTATLDRIVVSSTPPARTDTRAIPASITTIAPEAGATGAGVNVSEFLAGVPGLLARDRGNFAQDLQLSIRGFGARSTFGVRSLRLYADGVPATMPDGQGQVSHLALADAAGIEVMRGPFSSLYGHSSGGVLRFWTADGEPGMQGHLRAGAGHAGSRTVSAGLRGAGDSVGYAFSASRFETDGWRDHSAARRTTFNGKLHADTAGGGSVRLVANLFDAPDAQDPLGLTRAQLEQDPRQVAAVALQYDTRKSVRQGQLGLALEQPLGDGHALHATAYGGRREIEQFLAVPVAAQANPLHSGGVIDLDNDYGGLDLRWTWRGSLAGRPAEISLGANADRQRQQRQGFENFVDGALGIRGALRRDERNRVDNLDQYAQAWWQVHARWSLLAGARRSEVRFRSQDRYVTAANPDDSGRARYRQTSPVLGLSFAARDDLRLHLAAGRGFETPTFNEVGYRADGGAGLALDLRPAVSDNLEAGLKWRGGTGAALDASVFRTRTTDELAVARNVAGRSSFRNIGRSRRQGVEAAWQQPLGDAWDLQLAWTWLDARFRETAPPVPAGTRIPGVARQQFHARLQWRSGDWRGALETAALGDVSVNDAGSERAPGHALLHLEGGHRWRLSDGSLDAFVRVDNLFDKAHVGSVIVNEGNGRFYEPGAGRRLSLGLRWDWGRPAAH